MTEPPDPTQYPAPSPERIEQALSAMHARRARLRRVRLIGVSGALVVVVIAATLLAATSGKGKGHQLRVTGQSSTIASTAANTTIAPTTSSSLTTTTRASSTTTAPTPGTHKITYQPFTATGAVAPQFQVESRLTGTCVFGESSRSYRCFAKPSGGVYDPCFAGPYGTTGPLVCPSTPTSLQVVEFTATSVTSGRPVTTARPWAMQLSNGQICLFVSAAWGGLGPYGCKTANTAAVRADCREPQPSEPWWSANCQDQMTDASPFTPTEVTTIWF